MIGFSQAQELIDAREQEHRVAGSPPRGRSLALGVRRGSGTSTRGGANQGA